MGSRSAAVLMALVLTGCTATKIYVAPEPQRNAYTHVAIKTTLDPLNLRPIIAEHLRKVGYTVVSDKEQLADGTRFAAASFIYSFERDVFHDTFSYFYLEIKDPKTDVQLASVRFSGQSPRSAERILEGLMSDMTEQLSSRRRQ